MDDDDETYCAAPFRHLSYNPDGTVQPCCDWLGPTIKVDPSIENPMLTPWMDEFRHGLATGVEYSGCRVCRENEKAGAQSARNWMNQVYGKPTDIKIQWVEFNLGTLCNLKCRMCSSQASTKWIADEIAMGIVPAPAYRRNLSHLTADISQMDRLDFKGGEPTLEQDSIIEILEHIERVKGTLSDMWIRVTTNAMTMLNGRCLELLGRCRKVDLNISVDGIGVINDYQRTGSKWEDICENVLLYQHVCSPVFELSIVTALTFINASDFVNLSKWVCDVLPRYHHWCDAVVNPAWMSARNIPDAAKRSIAASVESWTDHDSKWWVSRNKKVVLAELDRTRNVPLSDMCKFTDRLDRLRKEDFRNINPKIYAAMFQAKAWQHGIY